MTTISESLTHWLSRSKSLSKDSLRSTSVTPDVMLRSEPKADIQVDAVEPSPPKADMVITTKQLVDEKASSEPELIHPTLGRGMRNSLAHSDTDKSERSWFDNRDSLFVEGTAEKWVVGTGGGIVRQRSATETTCVAGADDIMRDQSKFELSFGPDINEVSAVGLAM